jgi:hypothetical protein
MRSKEVLRQIDMERAREDARRAELIGLEGVEARRLEKIHMI